MKSSQPIILGVTGHRNFATNDERLAAIARGVCEGIRVQHPQASFVILSGLAEGADRLVVKVAQATLAAELTAVIPLPDDLYMKDFATPTSVAEYQDMLKAAQKVIRAPLLAPTEEVTEYGEPRNHQYAWQGAFIADRTHILIAIWDGAPARGTGGTAYVVDWFLKNTTPPEYGVSQAEPIRRAKKVERMLVHIHPADGSVTRKAATSA